MWAVWGSPPPVVNTRSQWQPVRKLVRPKGHNPLADLDALSAGTSTKLYDKVLHWACLLRVYRLIMHPNRLVGYAPNWMCCIEESLSPFIHIVRKVPLEKHDFNLQYNYVLERNCLSSVWDLITKAEITDFMGWAHWIPWSRLPSYMASPGETNTGTPLFFNFIFWLHIIWKTYMLGLKTIVCGLVLRPMANGLSRSDMGSELHSCIMTTRGILVC